MMHSDWLWCSLPPLASPPAIGWNSLHTTNINTHTAYQIGRYDSTLHLLTPGSVCVCVWVCFLCTCVAVAFREGVECSFGLGGPVGSAGSKRAGGQRFAQVVWAHLLSVVRGCLTPVCKRGEPKHARTKRRVTFAWLLLGSFVNLLARICLSVHPSSICHLTSLHASLSVCLSPELSASLKRPQHKYLLHCFCTFSFSAQWNTKMNRPENRARAKERERGIERSEK